MGKANEAGNEAEIRSSKAERAEKWKKLQVEYEKLENIHLNVNRKRTEKLISVEGDNVMKPKGETSATGHGGKSEKHPGSSHISNSSNSESSDEEPRHQKLPTRPFYYAWRRKIRSGKTARKNVLQIPQKVIRGSLQDDQSRILLVDYDTKERYECELHRAQRKYCVERYIGQGWYEFVRKKGLKRGDRLVFILRDPACDKLVVKILER